MACILNTGYTSSCMDSIAGVQAFYIRNWSSSTVYTSSADGTITGSTNSTSPYYVFLVRKETGAFNAGEGQYNLQNGTVFYNQTAEITMHKYQASLRNIIFALGQTEMEVIVKTQNNQYIAAGTQNGFNVSASSSGVGKAFGDLNGVTVTLIAKEPTPAPVMSSTFFSTLTLI